MREIDKLKKKLKKIEEQLKNLEFNARTACNANTDNLTIVAQQVLRLNDLLQPLFRDYRFREDAAYDALFELVLMTQKYPM